MKRIDDKIKEIEKKDKKNRIIYIAFVALIFAFMATAFIYQGIINKQRDDIFAQDATIKESKKELKKKADSLETANKKLLMSLQPDDYWEYTKNENSVEGYIAFITNKTGIVVEEFVPDAIDKLKSSGPEVAGFRGWLYVGSKYSDSTYKPREDIDMIEVIYRINDEDVDPKSEPQKGDIVKLKATQNQLTYKNKPKTSKNEYGWRNKTKAFVVDTYKEPGDNINFHIEIRYY